MRPRIIHSVNGTIDASKVSHVSEIKEYHSDFYSFCVNTKSECGISFTSSDLGKLQAIRRRLIGFVWPNADVFDSSKPTDASDSTTT
jgi:hypothetical protein